jgi:hypothetical protein
MIELRKMGREQFSLYCGPLCSMSNELETLVGGELLLLGAETRQAMLGLSYVGQKPIISRPILWLKAEYGVA